MDRSELTYSGICSHSEQNASHNPLSSSSRPPSARRTFIGTSVSADMIRTAISQPDNRGQKMADGRPLTAAWRTMSSCRFLESANVHPEMIVRVLRANPLVRLSYSLNPLGT